MCARLRMAIPIESGYHTRRRTAKDLNTEVDELHKLKVFNEVPKCKHQQFPKFIPNPMKDVNKKKLNELMTSTLISKLVI